MLYIIFVLVAMFGDLDTAEAILCSGTTRNTRRACRTKAIARKAKTFQEACCILKGNGHTEAASLPFEKGEEAKVLEYRFNTRRYNEYRRPRHGSQDSYRHGNKCRSVKEDRELAAANAKLAEYFS